MLILCERTKVVVALFYTYFLNYILVHGSCRVDTNFTDPNAHENLCSYRESDIDLAEFILEIPSDKIKKGGEGDALLHTRDFYYNTIKQ